MDTQVSNNRLISRANSNWPTLLIAAGLLIGLPLLARRFGLLQNTSLQPRELLGRATEAARGVTDKLGVNVPGLSKDESANDADITH